MKKLIWILVVVVLVGAVVYLNADKSVAPESEDVVSGENAKEETTSTGASLLAGSYGLTGVEWVFTQKSEGDGFKAPVASVRIQPVGVTRPDGRKIEVATWRLGDYQGSCAKIDKPADETVAALSYAQCWWAGGGDQFRVVRDGNSLRVDIRPVDEMEEAPATWKQLAVINLETIAQ